MRQDADGGNSQADEGCGAAAEHGRDGSRSCHLVLSAFAHGYLRLTPGSTRGNHRERCSGMSARAKIRCRCQIGVSDLTRLLCGPLPGLEARVSGSDTPPAQVVVLLVDGEAQPQEGLFSVVHVVVKEADTPICRHLDVVANEADAEGGGVGVWFV